MIIHKQLLLHFKNCKQIASSLGPNWGRLTECMMQTEVGLQPNVGCSKWERFLTKWTNWVLFIRYASETKEIFFFWQYSSRERSFHLGLTSNRPVIHKTVDDLLGAHYMPISLVVDFWSSLEKILLWKFTCTIFVFDATVVWWKMLAQRLDFLFLHT